MNVARAVIVLPLPYSKPVGEAEEPYDAAIDAALIVDDAVALVSPV
ncbi:MAG TPA: hypothetical protein VF777_07455 [Phycisphaerales bacterium]